MGKGPHSWTSTFFSCRSSGNELLQRSFVYLFWFSFLVVLSAGLVQPCFDDEPVSTVQMVLRSKVLIFGKVLRVYPDRRYDYGKGTEVYTAEMEVFCVLKGPRANRIVNITEAGYIPGHCTSTTLRPNQTFIVIADYNGSTYRPVDTEIAATSSNLDEVSMACGLDPKYPNGVSEGTATERCLTPAPPSQCKDETYYTTTTTTTTTMPSTLDYEYSETDYDPYSSNLPNDANKMDKTSRPNENPSFSKSSASLTSSPRSSDYVHLLQLMVAATTHLVLVFLPLSR